MMNFKNQVLIIDFGSQFAQIIARKINEFSIKCQIVDPCQENLLEKAKLFGSIIFSGGPESVNDKNFIDIDERILDLKIPILGICYGMQLIHKKLNGFIDDKNFAEFGLSELEIIEDHPLFKNVPKKINIVSSHNDTVTELANGFVVLAKTKICIASTANDEKKIYTLQFHPEVSDDDFGNQMIKNFLFGISHLKKTFEEDNFLSEKKEEIKNEIGNENILVAVSGGVDSTILAHLLKETIPNKQIFPIFIDNGLLRKNESKSIIENYKKNFKNFIFIDSSEEFISALKGIFNPEEKRKIIGKLFINIFNKFANEHKSEFKFLGQGTIYSDLIESGEASKSSKVIKSHHNVIGLIEEHNFELIEPLSELFKDEVRELGKQINVPDEILKRQPFPGPGLAVRIGGEVTKEKLQVLQDADAILWNELKKFDIIDKVKQSFCILLSSKSVGSKGDDRVYGYPIVIRIINSKDFMTCEVALIDQKILQEIANKIINQINSVTRVLFDLTNKPPGTIEWE